MCSRLACGQTSSLAIFGEPTVTHREVEALVCALFGGPMVILLDLVILKIKEYNSLAHKI